MTSRSDGDAQVEALHQAVAGLSERVRVLEQSVQVLEQARAAADLRHTEAEGHLWAELLLRGGGP